MAKGIEAVSVALSDYSDEVRDAVTQAITDVTAEAATKLHSAGSFNGTKYRKSWTSEIETTRTGISGVAYNAKHYRLTHLLEFGHAKSGGGRTRAFPHIADVNDWAQEEAEKRIEEAVGK